MISLLSLWHWWILQVLCILVRMFGPKHRMVASAHYGVACCYCLLHAQSQVCVYAQYRNKIDCQAYVQHSCNTCVWQISFIYVYICLYMSTYVWLSWWEPTVWTWPCPLVIWHRMILTPTVWRSRNFWKLGVFGKSESIWIICKHLKIFWSFWNLLESSLIH